MNQYSKVPAALSEGKASSAIAKVFKLNPFYLFFKTIVNL